MHGLIQSVQFTPPCKRTQAQHGRRDPGLALWDNPTQPKPIQHAFEMRLCNGLAHTMPSMSGYLHAGSPLFCTTAHREYKTPLQDYRTK